MARINLSHHYKFRQLARALGSRALARGTLELLWETAYEVADAYIGTPDDIADAVDWTGPPMDLVNLLIKCGFLEDLGAQYAVHDLWKNAPEYVRLRWVRTHPHETKKNRPWNAKVTSCVGKTPTRRGGDRPLPAPPRPAPVRTERPAAAPPDTIKVLTRLAHELEAQVFQTEADLKDALKALAAQHAIPYDGQSIGAAIDQLTHSRRPILVARGKGG